MCDAFKLHKWKLYRWCLVLSIHHYLSFTRTERERENETTVLLLYLHLTFTWIPNSRSSLMSSMFSFSMAAIRADRSKGSTQLMLRISGWSLFSSNNLIDNISLYFIIYDQNISNLLRKKKSDIFTFSQYEINRESKFFYPLHQSLLSK